MEAWHPRVNPVLLSVTHRFPRVCVLEYASVRNHLNFLIALTRFFFVLVLFLATTTTGNKRRRDAGGDARISSRWVDDGHW